MSEPSAIDVLPLTPARFADLATLFEEGGDPKCCWCTYFRSRGRDWSNSTAAGNRAELKALAKRDLAPGLVATLTMFERAGFTVVERRQWNATTPVRPIVRRAL